MNQLKIILLIILLILLVCINRKKEKFETKSNLKTKIAVRDELLYRCTDDINRLVNKITTKSLNKLGITSNTNDDPQVDTGHNIDIATKKISYAKTLDPFLRIRYPVPYYQRSIFTDIRDGRTLTNNENLQHDLISDFGILDVKSEFNISA